MCSVRASELAAFSVSDDLNFEFSVIFDLGDHFV